MPLNTGDCPRCGCWIVKSTKCHCGAVHGNYCANCGRWAAPALKRTQYTELEPMPGKFADLVPKRCLLGRVEHDHKLM
jgi:hypothetical protein